MENYMIWKKICKNKSIDIFKRKINKNNIPWYFLHIICPKLRDKIFKFG